MGRRCAARLRRAFEAHRKLIVARIETERASIGWNQNDFDVLEDGKIVGRIFSLDTSGRGRRWIWASGHNGDIKCAAYGYEQTRDAATAAFAKSWRRAQ